MKLYSSEESFEGTLDYNEPLPKRLKKEISNTF
jgi:hypothetical protein